MMNDLVKIRLTTPTSLSYSQPVLVLLLRRAPYTSTQGAQTSTQAVCAAKKHRSECTLPRHGGQRIPQALLRLADSAPRFH